MSTWNVYAVTKGGEAIFIQGYTDPDDTTARNTARWWMLNWIRNGDIPIPTGNEATEAAAVRESLLGLTMARDPEEADSIIGRSL